MFCSHDWTPRAGMDSGSLCSKCQAVSERECVPGSGLGEGRLAPSQGAFSRLTRRAAAFLGRPRPEEGSAPERGKPRPPPF